MAAIASAPGCVLASASQYPEHRTVGLDAGALAGVGANGLLIRDDASEALQEADVAIDFGTPAGTERHAALARAAGTPLVIGTTSMTPSQRRKVAEAAQTIPIVFAPNMSVGATLLMCLAKRIAAVFGPDYDLEVLGLQHRHKVDAPSGTALGFASAAAKGRGLDPETIAATPRDGHTGPRPRGLIGIATVQGGDMLGEHTIIAAGDGERIELAHRPSGRAVYAAGAVRAALWLVGKPPGLYGMADVLGLTD